MQPSDPAESRRLAWRITSGSTRWRYGYELVDEDGISRVTTKQSMLGTLKGISIGDRELLVKRQPFKSRFELLDRATRERIALANWGKQTIEIEGGPKFGRIAEPAPPGRWNKQDVWSTSDGRRALVLSWVANPRAFVMKPWPRGRVEIGSLELEDDCFLVACFATTFRTMSYGA